jgi:hypothetical protein
VLWDLGCRVKGFGLAMYGFTVLVFKHRMGRLGLQAYGAGFRVQGSGFRVQLVFGVWCLVIGVWCLVFGVW